MKKFITAVLIVTFILSLIVPTYALDTDTSFDGDFLIASELFNKLGIMENDMSDAKMKEMVTRGDFASKLYRLLGYDGITTTNVFYEDSYGLNEVNVLVQNGILPQNGTKFNPSENITFSEAVTWLMNATGWGKKAQAKGGMFLHYIREANQCGLFKIFDKNSFAESSELNTEDVIRLFYGAANVNLFYADSFSNTYTSYSESKDDTILTGIFDLYFVEDKVTADRYTGLYVSSEPCNDGYIRIGKKELMYKGNDYDTLIGKNVKAFYKDETDEIIALAEDVNANKTVRIKAEDVISYKNHSLKYYNEKGKSTTIRMSESTALIYNNSAVGVNHEGVIDNLKYGFVTVYQNADTKNYDVIVVDEYINAKITAVDAEYDTIYTDSDRAEAIRGQEYAYRKYFSADGVSNVFLSGYSKGDAVSAKISKNGSLVILYLSKSRVSGVVNSIENGNNNETLISIDGERYKVASDCDIKKDIKLGNVYTFMTNLFGDIIAISENLGENEAVMGYIYGYYESSRISGGIYVKVFTQYGEHNIYELEEKVILDGKRMMDSEVKEKLCDTSGKVKRALIRFALNADDKIVMLDTAAANVNDREAEGTLWEVCGVESRIYSHTEDIIKPNGSLAKNHTYVFIVPTDKNVVDEDCFGVMLYGGKYKPIGWTGNYMLGGYKFNTDYKALDAVIWEFNAETNTSGQKLLLVDKVTQRMGSDGVYTAVSGYAEGVYTTVITYDDSMVFGIGKGDTIVYTTVPGNNVIARAAKIIEYDPVTKIATPTWSDPNALKGTTNNVSGLMGYIRKYQRMPNGINESIMRIGKGKEEILFSFTESKFPVIVYDDGEFTVNDLSNIISSEYIGDDTKGDSIYLAGSYPYITYAIIYKSQE